VMAQRLQASKKAAAERGELRSLLPVRYVYDEAGEVVFDPDAEVQAAIRDVFAAFAVCGSAYGVVVAFAGRTVPAAGLRRSLGRTGCAGAGSPTLVLGRSPASSTPRPVPAGSIAVTAPGPRLAAVPPTPRGSPPAPGTIQPGHQRLETLTRLAERYTRDLLRSAFISDSFFVLVRHPGT
jgi:hypothetical protein